MIAKILIIEDEKLNADRLQRLVALIRPKAILLGVLESIEESVKWVQANELPDLIFMDIRLADGLSFEILEKVKLKCPIVFTTAYDEYAVRAFKYNSVDYLLKPVEKDELESAIIKVEERRVSNSFPNLEGLLNYVNQKDYRTRFLLPYRDGYKTILINDVAYFYSEMKITRAMLLNGTEVVLPQTMEELEQQLDPKNFFRANRQFIIHIDSIQEIHNYFNGKLKLILKHGADAEITVSRDKAPILKQWMDY